jgi:hypothetical protein
MAKKQDIRSTEGRKGSASSQGKASSPDKLTKVGKKGDIELSEDELKGVAGGAFDAFSKVQDKI